MSFSASTLLVGKGIRPVKNWVVAAGVAICLEWGADLSMAQLMPLPLIVSWFSNIQIGFTFLVPAHPGSPGKRAAKRVSCRRRVMHDQCNPRPRLHSRLHCIITALWRVTLHGDRGVSVNNLPKIVTRKQNCQKSNPWLLSCESNVLCQTTQHDRSQQANVHSAVITDSHYVL